MKIIKDNLQIIIVSFISLFLELRVIRLIGTEIRIFAYFSNLVLLAIFVGLGLGMIVKTKFSIITTSSLLFLLTIIISTNYIVRWPNLEFKLFSGITELLAPLSESYIWLQLQTYSKTGIVIGIILTILLFLMIVLIFMPLGQILGNLLQKHNKPILVYSINVAASLAGLWAFQAFSLARFSPYFGIILALGALIFFAKNQVEKLALIIIFLTATAFIVPRIEAKNITYWSPYQKLTLSPAFRDETNVNPQPGGWYLEVNNVGYMSLLNLSEEYQATAAAKLNQLYNNKPEVDVRFADQYSLPYKLKPDSKNVLIVGAGAGNDAAAALRSKIEQIDAVEIDPTIIEIGKKFHYEKPYAKNNVNVIIDDGRAYFERTDKKYDLVVMGLADSHTLSSSLTNLRLDHYLYTKESFQKIKDILSDRGVLFLTFEVTRPWMGARIEKGLTDVFGQKPKTFENRSQGVFGWGGYSFVVSKNPGEMDNLLEKNPDLSTFITQNTRNFSTSTNPLTDDWPYLYLDKPRLPVIHLLVALILGGSLVIFRRRFLGTSTLDVPMFFWGAAFLLFEFQNISKTSLLFGITWVTNLFTISAILLLLLLANLTVAKKLISSKTAFIFLIIAIICQYFVPLSRINSWSYWQKIIVASIFLNLPVYFGGIIFTNMFAKAKDKANALGSNFLGSVFGGFAEMITFLTGIHSLLILVVIFYTLGYLFANNLKILSNLKFRT
ncbi:MAG: hypothetical protein Q8P25_01560 [Candidatus Curtissbacteria bacterium]|nr:hypothetical protein [Candidatus Curtissbacteria bacterium]